MTRGLVYLDRKDIRRSAQLFEVVRSLYPEALAEAVIFGEGDWETGDFFDEVHHFLMSEDSLYDVRRIAKHIQDLQEEKQYDCIVIPATREGRMMAPALAMKLQTGLVADVVEVSRENEEICMVRPAFDGKLMACITNQSKGPVMMTVRPGAFRMAEKHIPERKESAKVIVHRCEKEAAPGIHLLEKQEAGESKDIREARALVSGGGGVGERFPQLEKLADLLHGMVSSSRRLVDAGITPRSIQVGQSGKIVSPRLYVALGIYGSLQHMEGLSKVGDIIAVNTNKNAPICSLASVVVEGDAIEFVEKLSKKIIKEKEK